MGGILRRDNLEPATLCPSADLVWSADSVSDAGTVDVSGQADFLNLESKTSNNSQIIN